MAPANRLDDQDLLNNSMCKGGRLEYIANVNGFKLLVVLKKIDQAPDYFMVSVECPFFSVYREMVKTQEVIKEIEKILNFLKSDGSEP